GVRQWLRYHNASLRKGPCRGDRRPRPALDLWDALVAASSVPPCTGRQARAFRAARPPHARKDCRRAQHFELRSRRSAPARPAARGRRGAAGPRLARLPLAAILAAALGACGGAPSGDAPVLARGEVASPAPPGSAQPDLSAAPDGRVLLSWLEPELDSTHALR